MNCEARVEELSALLDGELSPSSAASLTEHLTTCPICAQRLAELAGLRAALADAVPAEDVSPQFLARITSALDGSTETASPVLPFRPNLRAKRLRPPSLRSFASGIAVAAIAATVALAVLPHKDKTVDFMAVRDAALRSALSASAALTQPAPPVAGFRLLAARADVVVGHPARVMVYEGSGGTVTLCIWKANGEPAHGLRTAMFRGMAIRYWNNGLDEYWVASAGPPAALEAFMDALRQQGHAVSL